MVVMAIIGVLATLVSAVFQNARRSSDAAVDLSNLRDIATAVNTYVAEENYYPGESWTTCIFPTYVSDAKIFKSPSDKRAMSDDMQTIPVSYDLNSNLWGLLMVEVIAPSQCVLLAPLAVDPVRQKFQSTVWRPGMPSPLNLGSNQAEEASDSEKRDRRIPVIFADTHTANFSMEDFLTQMPNPDGNSIIEDLRWNRRARGGSN